MENLKLKVLLQKLQLLVVEQISLISEELCSAMNLVLQALPLSETICWYFDYYKFRLLSTTECDRLGCFHCYISTLPFEISFSLWRKTMEKKKEEVYFSKRKDSLINIKSQLHQRQDWRGQQMEPFYSQALALQGFKEVYAADQQGSTYFY